MDDNSRDACTYASLILMDDNLDITGDKINAILKSASIDFVPAFLPGMFAKLLANNPRQLLMNLGSSPAPVASSDAPVAANNTGAQKEEAKEEKKAESSSESDADMGFGLFD